MAAINRSVLPCPISRRHRLSRILKPELDRKQGKQLRGFETADEVQAEDRKRLSLVAQTFGRLIFVGEGAVEIEAWLGPDRNPLQPVQSLLRALGRDQDDNGWRPSLASSVTMRAVREEVLGRVLEFLEPWPDHELRTFTIINKGWRVRAEELRLVDPATIIRQFRTHLNRAEVSTIEGPLIAFVHGEYEPRSGFFQLHLHGITTKEKAERLRALVYLQGRVRRRWGYEQTATGAAPRKCYPIRHRARQVSYLLKAFWPQRMVRIAGGRPRRDRKGHRIGDPHHLLVLLWLDRHRWTDLALLQGCRFRKNGELRRT